MALIHKNGGLEGMMFKVYEVLLATFYFNKCELAFPNMI